VGRLPRRGRRCVRRVERYGAERHKTDRLEVYRGLLVPARRGPKSAAARARARKQPSQRLGAQPLRVRRSESCDSAPAASSRLKELGHESPWVPSTVKQVRSSALDSDRPPRKRQAYITASEDDALHLTTPPRRHGPPHISIGAQTPDQEAHGGQ
jgi:hypothetical protein